MGQRHQIYLKLPKPLQSSKQEPMLGLHHQWLYGFNAVRQLARTLQFIAANVDEPHCPLRNSYEDPKSVFPALYSVDHEAGYYHRVHILTNTECDDPRLGDNNNGITIIDARGDKPKYCFMSLGHLECLDEIIVKQPKAFKPIDARSYLTLHYPYFETDYPNDSEEKILGKQRMRRFCNFMDKFEVLTLAECKKLFPDMYKKEPATTEAEAIPF